jgi:hypothetical protein
MTTHQEEATPSSSTVEALQDEVTNTFPFPFPRHCIRADGLVANFAFGSNLSAEKMRARGIPIERSCRAHCPGYVLTFNQQGFPPCEPSFANIEKRNNEKTQFPHDIHGIVFFLKPENFAILWASEGSGGWYREETVSCISYDDGEIIEGVTAFLSLPKRLTNNGESQPPSLRYMNLMRNGSKNAGLEGEYVDFLNSLPAAPAASRFAIAITPFFFVYINTAAKLATKLGGKSTFSGRCVTAFESHYGNLVQNVARRVHNTMIQELVCCVVFPGAVLGWLAGFKVLNRMWEKEES